MCSDGDAASRPSWPRAFDTTRKRRDVLDAPLHRREPDQVAVELLQHLEHVRVAQDGLQVDGGCGRGVHELAFSLRSGDSTGAVLRGRHCSYRDPAGRIAP